MKSVFYSPEKAEQEKIEKTKAQIDNERKIKYFERLKSDKWFQKYVMEEIIDREIRVNQDLSTSLATLIANTPENIKGTLIAQSGALEAIKNIKKKIQNPI